jgi:formate dehydrogenase gamma subunit
MSEEALRMTKSKPTQTEPQPAAPDTHPKLDRIRVHNFRRMILLANRVHILPDGERLFVRFSQAEILEHWVLLGAFIVLALTGLLEMLANNEIPADIITLIFRNIDNVRSFHNMTAVVYAGLALVHIVRVLSRWFVKGDLALLIPTRRDFGDLGRTWKYLLSRNSPRPESARFTIDQKLTYWAIFAFSTIMILTALVMWYQTTVMLLLPEALLPFVRSLHSLIGVLAVATLLPWHIYNTLLKEWNSSIFTGTMDEKTLRRNHPLEYREIMEAVAAFQNYKTGNTTTVDALQSVEKQEAIEDRGSQKKP